MRVSRPFLQDRNGATAVEFAVIAPLLMLTIVFILVVAVIQYYNQALDYATNQATRQVLLGNAQANGTSQAAFQTSLCGFLPKIMPCNNIVVNLYVVTPGTSPAGYYAFVKPDLSGLLIPPLSSGPGQYNVGGSGAYQYLQVIYPITFVPRVFASMLGGGNTLNGSPVYLAISTAAFRNEKF